MPRLLRPLFRKRRELLDEISLAGAEAVTEAIREAVGEDVSPRLVVSIATAGDLVQFHPRLHILGTDGAFAADGSFSALPAWDAEKVMKLFRRRLLDRLMARKAISEELVKKLLAWRHPGFSAHVGQVIPFEDKKTLEDLACYLTRNPLSLKKLVYLDGQSAVLYRSRLNPRLRRNFEAMDPLEWLARLSDHIPDPGKHRVHFYGAYACRRRGAHRASEELAKEGCEPEPAGKKKRCPPSWARLIHKVYQADPLVCRRCGGKIKIVGTSTIPSPSGGSSSTSA
jgi:hypothetical protein